MRKMAILLLAALTAGAENSSRESRASDRGAKTAVADTIIALERAALDRWGRGDPTGYVETYARAVTSFDPFAAKRVDGIDSIKAMLEPITGKVHIDSYEMLNPRVQPAGDVAVLSFNLVSHVKNPDGSPRTVRWNSTEVYRRIGGRGRIIHNHWSFTKPELK